MVLNILKFIYWRGGSILLFVWMELILRRDGFITCVEIDGKESDILWYWVWIRKTNKWEWLSVCNLIGGFDYSTISYIIDQMHRTNNLTNMKERTTKNKYLHDNAKEIANMVNHIIEDAQKENLFLTPIIQDGKVDVVLTPNREQ